MLISSVSSLQANLWKTDVRCVIDVYTQTVGRFAARLSDYNIIVVKGGIVAVWCWCDLPLARYGAYSVLTRKT